jgi:hypothetical protein
MKSAFFALFATALLAFAPQVQAHEGHDHGEAPAPQGPAAPRLVAHSDLFELVGVLANGRLTVYLDRHATNEPVAGARIEYEAGAAKGVAAPQPDGTYRIELAALDRPGVLPFAFTVSAAGDTDLLAGELDLHAQAEPAHQAGTPWVRIGAAAAAIALLGAAAFFLVRGRRLRAAASAR